MPRGLALRLVLLLGVAPCACKAPGQLVLGFATDLSAPDVLDRVEMRVLDESGAVVVSEGWDLPGVRARDYTLPGSFTLVAASGEPQVRVELVGMKGGAPILTREAALQFTEETDLFFRMTLVQRCMGMVCAAGETCFDGRCRSAIVPAVSLRAYAPGRVEAMECDGGRPLIRTDSHEPMPISGSGFCAVDEWCGEATCYRNRAQGLLWCTDPTQVCDGVDGYEACVIDRCAAPLAQCYGPDWQRGRFAGPCEGYAGCRASCGCDPGCVARCDDERPAACGTCLDSSVGPCELAAACPPPSCAARPVAMGDGGTSPVDGNRPDGGLPFGPNVLPVAAGTYVVGCDDSLACPSDTQPSHRVDMSGFFIDRHEVTVIEYMACVQKGQCTAPMDPQLGPDDGPVGSVTWTQAQQYCVARGNELGVPARLPTEHEWEVAAHGVAGVTTQGTTYPWGDSDPPADCSLASFDLCSPSGLRSVGGRPLGASPFGLEDMAGNADEWVFDWYDAMLYPFLKTQEPVINPIVDTQGPHTERVKRGGGHTHDRFGITAFVRYSATPASWFPDVGFRCAYLFSLAP